MDLLNKSFPQSDSETTGSSFSAFSGIGPLELSNIDIENISFNNDISFKDLSDDFGAYIELVDLDEIIVGNNNAVDYNVPSPEEVSAPRGEKRKHSDIPGSPDDSSQSPTNGFGFSTSTRKRVKPLLIKLNSRFLKSFQILLKIEVLSTMLKCSEFCNTLGPFYRHQHL